MSHSRYAKSWNGMPSSPRSRLTRYPGEQRCLDSQRSCRRVGPGGSCPRRDEPVALADLIAYEGR